MDSENIPSRATWDWDTFQEQQESFELTGKTSQERNFSENISPNKYLSHLWGENPEPTNSSKNPKYPIKMRDGYRGGVDPSRENFGKETRMVAQPLALLVAVARNNFIMEVDQKHLEHGQDGQPP